MENFYKIPEERAKLLQEFQAKYYFPIFLYTSPTQQDSTSYLWTLHKQTEIKTNV